MEIEDCIHHAGRMGFDGVEILQMQMPRENHGYLQIACWRRIWRDCA